MEEVSERCEEVPETLRTSCEGGEEEALLCCVVLFPLFWNYDGRVKEKKNRRK